MQANTDASNFYPRPPGGGRRDVMEIVGKHLRISIHALRVEGDIPVHILRDHVEISIHALRVEGDFY